MKDDKKKCIARKCKDCNWYRFKQMEKVDNSGKPTGIAEMVEVCLFEFYFDALHFTMGSLDGLQSGVNEARNRSMETKAEVVRFGQAAVQAIKVMGLTVKEVKGKSDEVQGLPSARKTG